MKTDTDCIKLLDDFYQRHCNDEWEHFYGVTIQTCDNPGWWVTVTDPDLYKILISFSYDPVIKKISDEWDVIITYKNEHESKNHPINVFGSSLEKVLNSTAILISHIDKSNS